jgi:hypothetical protein
MLVFLSWQKTARKAENAVSASLHFQSLTRFRMAPHPCAAGTAE